MEIDITAGNFSGGADLVSRILSGDRQAEAELVDRYSRGVALIIRRETRDASQADDLYEETFCIVLEKIPAWRPARA